MDPVQELLDWAISHGVKLNGIAPTRVLGRGIGVIATRDIQVSQTQHNRRNKKRPAGSVKLPVFLPKQPLTL
jgi:hypothetical protein